MKPFYEQFTSKEQLRTIDARRVSYAVIMVLSFFMTEIGRRFYRPIIYRNEFNDFGLADSIGNLGGIVVQIFLGLLLMNSNLKQGFKLIGFLVMGSCNPFCLREHLIGKMYMEPSWGELLPALYSA